MEPAAIAKALWLSHDYEVDRYALLFQQPRADQATIDKQRERLAAATAAARAATEYANLFGKA